MLGATGAVGQRFVEHLDRHPQFVVSRVAASERSQGKPYREACTWRLPVPMPEAVGVLTVQDLTPDPDTREVPKSIRPIHDMIHRGQMSTIAPMS